MDYKVIITHPARDQLDDVIRYILYELQNEQAALSVMQDADETGRRLSRIAGNLKLCDDPRLRTLGYRMIHFKNHHYFMLYRIEGSMVYVDAVYHDLQDYENISE